MELFEYTVTILKIGPDGSAYEEDVTVQGTDHEWEEHDEHSNLVITREEKIDPEKGKRQDNLKMVGGAIFKGTAVRRVIWQRVEETTDDRIVGD